MPRSSSVMGARYGRCYILVPDEFDEGDQQAWIDAIRAWQRLIPSFVLTKSSCLELARPSRWSRTCQLAKTC
jgi:hypothetical protein